ncbi:FGGY-family carbohydrate kinase [Micromonospora sp. NPDC007271]|uniref:FGGY-family carbohydrate kinase n=1 Tax=Micromonospora sp. NPDC007271 TaxID=3154587 RepID=UPI0033E7AD42
MTDVVVGVDAGTTTVKAVVMDARGEVVHSASRRLAVSRPNPGWAEQDMDETWQAVAAVLREAVSAAGKVTITAVGVTGQGDGAWLLDDAGRPARPAILWLDGRATDIVTAWEKDGRAQAVFDATASVLFPGALPPLLDWLQENEPHVLARATHHLNCKDWIRYRLTGSVQTDPSEASRTYLDVETGQYADRLLLALGHDRHVRLLPPVVPSASVGGTVTGTAAAETGLPAGIPVVVGAVDTSATAAGLGLHAPGAAYAVLGTTAFYAVLSDHVVRRDEPMGFVLPAGLTDGWVTAMSPMAAAPNLDWVVSALGMNVGEWRTVEAEAEAAGPGAGGVLYLPYISESGERAPFVDPHASAGFVGVRPTTTRGHLLRAVYEGVALTMADCLAELPDADVVKLAGGASSAFFCQVIADIIGRPVLRPATDEFGARGVAAAALAAAGLVTSVEAGLAAVSRDGQLFTPRAEHRSLHATQLETFRALRNALAPTWPALRRLGHLATTKELCHP